MNGWTFEETVKTAENLMESERNMFKWDVLRHLRDFAELFFEELRQYREIKERLKAVYGECDGLLETAVDQAVENAVSILEKHEGIDMGDPYKSRLLTDEDVDKWEAYRAIGTPEECRAAVEKQKAKKPSYDDYHRAGYRCQTCNNVNPWGYKHCKYCGQKLDWGDEE